jgi:GNAT superfamily N-acetyltransferase
MRPAVPDEGDRLREIEIASKAHWGYDADFMSRFASVISMSPEYVRKHDVWVLETRGDMAGFYGLIHHEDFCELDHLWLLPRFIGSGFGRLMFQHAVQRAAEVGATRLEWEAEPKALGFYHRMGARQVRETQSALGRTVPVMALDLDQI